MGKFVKIITIAASICIGVCIYIYNKNNEYMYENEDETSSLGNFEVWEVYTGEKSLTITSMFYNAIDTLLKDAVDFDAEVLQQIKACVINNSEFFAPEFSADDTSLVNIFLPQITNQIKGIPDVNFKWTIPTKSNTVALLPLKKTTEFGSELSSAVIGNKAIVQYSDVKEIADEWYNIDIQLYPEAAKIFSNLTKRVCKNNYYIAFVVDDIIQMYAIVGRGINDGKCNICGKYTHEAAHELAKTLVKN